MRRTYLVAGEQALVDEQSPSGPTGAYEKKIAARLAAEERRAQELLKEAVGNPLLEANLPGFSGFSFAEGPMVTPKNPPKDKRTLAL